MVEYSDKAARDENQLEDDGRGWCAVRTYITGPGSIRAGTTGQFKSNVHVDADPGCKSHDVDEVLWTIDMPNQFKDQIHVRNQSADECTVAVEATVSFGHPIYAARDPQGPCYF
jgi:hypothetical protein